MVSPAGWRQIVRSAALALLFPWAAAAASPPAPFLVRDLETQPVNPGANPVGFARLGSYLYFSATDALHGRELWRTDGTVAGTTLVADLCPGRCSSSVGVMIAALGRLFLVADDGVTGSELWMSDGTAAGTHRVKDICPGRCSGLLDGAAAEFGGTLYFTADDGVTGVELWKTDGTAAGTMRVADINPGPGSSAPGSFIPFGGRLVFTADDGVHGRQLWATDGTAAGTLMVHDFCPGACTSGVAILAAAGGKLFVATGSLYSYDSQLWMVDTNFAVTPVTGLCAGNGCLQVEAVSFGGAFLVAAKPKGLFLVDPATAQGTLLHEFDDFIGGADLTVSGGAVFFRGYDAEHGQELWTTDGSAGGTRLVADLTPGKSSEGTPFSSWPDELSPFLNGVLFAASTAGGGATTFAPWFSDGTLAGTVQLRAAPPQAAGFFGFTALGSRALFAAPLLSGPYLPSYATDLWSTDGSPAGTVEVAEIGHDPGSSTPAHLTGWNARLFFAATVSGLGNEPWTSDGSSAGTALLADLQPGPDSSSPNDFTPFAGGLYFTAYPHQGPAVWRTDGSASGTSGVPGSSWPARALTAAAPGLFFIAQIEGGCFFDCPEPFILPAGGAAATLVKRINPYWNIDPLNSGTNYPAGSADHDLTPLGGRLLFGADDGDHGDELWASDGTAAGTVLVADLCPGTCSSGPRDLVALGASLVLFTTGSPSNGFPYAPTTLPRGLWRTDGTAAGTVQLQPFSDLAYPDGPRELVAAAGRIFFLVGRPGGDELWASDGTAAGTARVSQLGLDGTPARARHLTAVDHRLFLAVFHDSTGEELWTSDGTSSGTRLVADIAPGPASASPQELTAIDGHLVFGATDGATGVEPWVSDGTAAGTFRLADIAPGPDASSPAEFTAVGDLVYFSAGDREHGRELWAFPRAMLANPFGCFGDETTLCLEGGRFAVSVRWQSPNVSGARGPGHAVPRTDQSGLFWFFDPGSADLLVKMVDGRALNQRFWFFSAGLSDVFYEIAAKDLATGLARTYTHPHGKICGQADTGAFPAHAGSREAGVAPATAPALAPAVASPGGQGAPSTLSLLGGRFRVGVTFRDPRPGGPSGPGNPMPGGDETGFFWFFSPASFELGVKMLDGRAVNGHFWIFYGALTDVEYILTVTDATTGVARTYRHPAGQVCGGADTAAF
jgi:ELWxxDGT repeat protein